MPPDHDDLDAARGCVYGALFGLVLLALLALAVYGLSRLS